MTLLRNPVSIVWIVLMVGTCISTWVLSTEAFVPVVATVGVFVIAAVKIHFVMSYFMELRDAPVRVRLVFEAWIVAAVAVILGIYLATR
ncbi:MAG TPA: cytochrome C oxidase subunit IV family protein [Pseudonocardia sp.]|jgi:heme/copper-type cytochrome/quinol oxidase subunit 4|uniref:cytochrome C oxidase subunit IV family protein n=1 Tax=Pseudonocardia sp. TaxID=60912 RepID=UPI002F42B74D